MVKSKIYTLFIFCIFLLSFSITGLNSSSNLNNNYKNVIFSSYYGLGGDSDAINSVQVDNAGYIYILSGKYVGYDQTVFSKFTPGFKNLVYQKILGGSASTDPSALAIDSKGNIYVTGITWSTDFPLVKAFQTTNNGQGDVFLTKYSNNGTILFSTLIGGSGQEVPGAISIDNNGNVLIAGKTTSPNYPIKNNKITNSNFNKIFLSQFSPNGSLLFSSLYGGLNGGNIHDMVIDKNNNCYLAGYAYNYYQVNNSYGNGSDREALVLVVSLNNYDLTNSILIGGGPGNDEAFGIASDNTGNIIITGQSQSTNYPLVNPLRNVSEGGWESFMSVFSPDGAHLLFSSYLGGNSTDYGRKVLVNDNNSILLTGYTFSEKFMGFERVNNNSVNADVYFLSLNNNYTINYEKNFGGSGNDYVYDTIMPNNDSLYFTGITDSTDFPLVNAFKQQKDADTDGFIFEISNDNQTYDLTTSLISSSSSSNLLSSRTSPITTTTGNEFSIVFLSFLVIDVYLVLKKRRKY